MVSLAPMVTLAAEKRSGLSGYQWYHWLPTVPLVFSIGTIGRIPNVRHIFVAKGKRLTKGVCDMQRTTKTFVDNLNHDFFLNNVAKSVCKCIFIALILLN